MRVTGIEVEMLKQGSKGAKKAAYTLSNLGKHDIIRNWMQNY